LYEEYNAMIKGLVPPEKLLEYHVSEGWGPLCKWLGKRFPKRRCRMGILGAILRGGLGRCKRGGWERLGGTW
jgi:hypothetical protein